MVQEGVIDSHIWPLGDAVARYPVIGMPPSPRGVHVTLTELFPRVTREIVGATGTPRGEPDVTAAVLVPAADLATTEIE